MDKKEISIKVNEKDYEYVCDLCDGLGIDVDTAINIYFKQMLYHQGIPFPINLPPLDFDEPPHHHCHCDDDIPF